MYDEMLELTYAAECKAFHHVSAHRMTGTFVPTQADTWCEL